MSGIKLLKRSNTYYFRSKIPQDIFLYINRREIWKSLQTDNYKTAKVIASKLLYLTERLFLHVRSGMYTNPEIKQLVKEYLHTVLGRKEFMRTAGVVTYQSPNEKPFAFDTDAGTAINNSLVALDEIIKSNQNKLFLNDLGKISEWVDTFLREKGVAPFEKGSPEYTTLCREILKAEIESLKVEKNRIVGDYDNPYDKFIENHTEQRGNSSAAVTQPQGNELQQAIKISQVIQENINEAGLGGNWTEKTKAENEGIYQVMIDILGDIDIKTVTHQTMMQFRDKLAKLPANRDKIKEYKGKSIEQILTMRNVVPMSKTTVNKYLIRTSTLFKWAVKHGYIPTNVAEGLTLTKTRRVELEREAYSQEDIQNVINNLGYDKAQPHHYWVPLIGMYQGMRLDEICQLHVDDIVMQEDIPCISVNGAGDKKMKNQSSERIIPIHPMLIRLGFLDYINGLMDTKQPRLWGKLTKKRDGYSQDFGKWYQRFNRKYVTKNPKRVFHSFRHSLANTLKQIGVTETVIAEIVGHSTASSMTMGRYGKRYQPKVLLEALKRLDYQIVFPE